MSMFTTCLGALAQPVAGILGPKQATEEAVDPNKFRATYRGVKAEPMVLGLPVSVR